jgi:hypothetical protein
MRDRRSPHDLPILKWAVFLIVLTTVMVWAVGGVLGRAGRMQTANTPASMFARTVPGSRAKVVIRLDQVAGVKLKGTLLERESDTAYRVPIESSSAVNAILTPETSVVMGRPQDIMTGAVVQLAGTLDKDRVLHAKQIVVLTGYVHLMESAVTGHE